MKILSIHYGSHWFDHWWVSSARDTWYPEPQGYFWYIKSQSYRQRAKIMFKLQTQRSHAVFFYFYESTLLWHSTHVLLDQTEKEIETERDRIKNNQHILFSLPCTRSVCLGLLSDAMDWRPIQGVFLSHSLYSKIDSESTKSLTMIKNILSE